MIGQLHKNFRKSVSIGAICAVLYAPSIYADHIGGNQITASTSMPEMVDFPIDQIADGINPGAGGHNGFQTNNTAGTITLDFDQAYDLESFKLWNDVVLRAEGVKSFRLDFETPTGRLSSQIFEAAAREPDVQVFEFPKINNVIAVDFVVLSSHLEPGTATLLPTFAHRIEVREVAFTGKPSNVAPLEGDSTTQIAEMEDYIDGLQDIIKGHEADKRDLESNLEKEKRRADSTFDLLKQRDETIAALSINPTATTTLALLEEQKEEIAELEAKITKFEEKGFDLPLLQIILGGLSLLTLGGLLGFLLKRRITSQPNPFIENNQLEKFDSKEKKLGIKSYPLYVIEAKASELSHDELDITPVLKRYPQDMRNYDKTKGELTFDLAGGLVVSGGSKFIAGQGNITTNILGVKTAYNAVGRVGLEQDGPAIGDDYSFGTAILIAKDRVITNRHVLDKVYKRIVDKEDPFGVEFFGEKDSDATDFYELTLEEAVIIEEYDAAILKLKKTVPEKHRKPIAFTQKMPEEWDDEAIYVIGYPADPPDYTDQIRAAMGDDLVFGVKRYSAGKIFKHPQDTDGEYGIETIVNGEKYSKRGLLRAICHQASTLPGNSGSAIISQDTGELLGLHFGVDQFDRHKTLGEYPANVAHAGQILSKYVTYITSDAFQNFLRTNQ